MEYYRVNYLGDGKCIKNILGYKTFFLTEGQLFTKTEYQKAHFNVYQSYFDEVEIPKNKIKVIAGFRFISNLK